MPSRAGRSTSHLPELTALVDRYTLAKRENRLYATAIDGVSTLRSDPLRRFGQCMIKPALCITVQGEKTATFASKLYEYRAGHGLVVTAEMPERGTVCAESKDKPYLGLVIELNLETLQELAEERFAQTRTHAERKGAGPFTFELNDKLLDCALRAARLFGMPDAVPVLYPGIMREICYWLLKGPGGDQLQNIIMMANAQDRRVMQAIQQLRNRFREPVHAEELARAARMSSTTFHRQFKMITSMTPLQYQKQLRLFEARRLMISEHATVEGAAFEVGYASVSQFSREYVRTFGSPPRREISAWRTLSPTESAACWPTRAEVLSRNTVGAHPRR